MGLNGSRPVWLTRNFKATNMTENQNITNQNSTEVISTTPQVAIIEIGDAISWNRTIRINDKVVIDASDHVIPGRGKPWTDRAQLEKWGKITDGIRRIIASSLHYRDVSQKDMLRYSRLSFIQEMHNLGFTEVTSSKINGKVPSWWFPTGPGKNYVLNDEKWNIKKQELNKLEKDLKK